MPTTDELLTIINRATNRLMLQLPKVDWIPLPWSADSLEPPDAAGSISVGLTVAIGEPEGLDREVWWHPGRQQGRAYVGGGERRHRQAERQRGLAMASPRLLSPSRGVSPLQRGNSSSPSSANGSLNSIT